VKALRSAGAGGYIGSMKCPGPTYNLTDDFRERLNKFVDSFLAGGLMEFSDDFHRIGDFVAAAQQEDPNRDAHNLRLTPEPIYLVEAVAFAVHDRVNTERFNKAKKTLIVLPDCLSIHEVECQKEDSEYGDLCRQCLPTCQAYAIHDVAARYDIPVVFSKRKLEEQLEHYADKADGDFSVIGIACLMMLARGMRTAADVGIPARGVPLACTGCEHWNDEQFASRVSVAWLESILVEKYGDDYNGNTTDD